MGRGFERNARASYFAADFWGVPVSGRWVWGACTPRFKICYEHRPLSHPLQKQERKHNAPVFLFGKLLVHLCTLTLVLYGGKVGAKPRDYTSLPSFFIFLGKGENGGGV